MKNPMVSSPRLGRRGSLLALVAVATVLGVIVAIKLSTSEQGTHERGYDGIRATGFGAVAPPERGPFALGEKVSLAESEAIAPFPILRPAASLASDATITAVWIQDAKTDDGVRDVQVAIDYMSGIEVVLQQVSFDP